MSAGLLVKTLTFDVTKTSGNISKVSLQICTGVTQTAFGRLAALLSVIMPPLSQQRLWGQNQVFYVGQGHLENNIQ